MRARSRDKVNWGRVGLFLGATFGLTWLLDLAIWLTVGYTARAAGALQLQMLLPALCAIVLGMFFFQDGPLYRARVEGERPRVFYYYYLVYCALVAVAAALPLAFNSQSVFVAASTAVQGLTLLGLVVLIVLRLTGQGEAFGRAGLGGGRPIYWLLFSLGFVLFYALQALLNWAFRLGEPVDLEAFMRQALPAGAEAMSPLAFLLAAGLQSLLLGPFLGLLFGFGEECGWRGYLQGALIKLGKVRGIALVGVIWGLWHAPVIAMGHNYPGYPIVGIGVMTAYTVGLAFALGYAVLKSGSVLLAAYLHALNNGVWSFTVALIYRPGDPVLSFGIGVYGLIVLALAVLLILRDPVWR